MSPSRLALVAVVAVGLAVVAATQTCRERSPADVAADHDAKAADPAAGVSPRAADSPLDLRERDRLREDEAAPPPPGIPTTPETAAPEPPRPPRDDPQEGAEPPTAVGPPASPTIEAALSAAKAAAQDEVAKARTEMRRTCWDGTDREGGVQLAFSLSFDPQGHVVASAVQQQSREGYVPGLDTCLAPFAHSIEIPAPGESVSVDVELELP